jgi:hypothetical protein
MADWLQRPYNWTMARAVITTEEGVELERLWQRYWSATRRAMAAIASYGMNSKAFADADAEAGVAIREIKRILGVTGQHWMA